MGFQEIDIVRMVTPITKYAVTVLDPNSIRYHLEKALYLARHGRPGPVWIDIPLDVQAAQIDPARLAGLPPGELCAPADEQQLKRQVAEAIQLFNRAERPCILVGNGVRLSDGVNEFSELIATLQAPVIPTWKALDLVPDDHPLYAGRAGSVGQRAANFTLQNSDYLLSLGARLDYGQTGYSHEHFARAAGKIIVDIDPAEIAKLNTHIDLSVAADARVFLREFLAQKDAIVPRDRTAWLSRVAGWKEKYPVVLPEYWQQQAYVNNYVFVQVLSEEMCGSDLLVPGSSGACSEITMQAFPVKAGMRVLNTEGLGPMGFGIAAALGACIASGKKRTVSIDGDGGFHMNSQELETVRRLNLPIKFFVLNNDGYGSIRSSQRAYFQNRFVASDPSSGLTLPDLLKIGKAYEIKTERIVDHGQLRETIRRVLQTEGPVLCEVMISPDQFTSPKLSSMQRADGSMVSKPLEDLWPFLPRDEFRANMIVPTLEED
jgi:acetolactate synthase-1/2/3 large subunit